MSRVDYLLSTCDSAQLHLLSMETINVLSTDADTYVDTEMVEIRWLPSREFIFWRCTSMWSIVSFWRVKRVCSSYINIYYPPPPANSTPLKKGTPRWQGLQKDIPACSYPVQFNSKSALEFSSRVVYSNSQPFLNPRQSTFTYISSCCQPCPG
jgi:hypothetical protein